MRKRFGDSGDDSDLYHSEQRNRGLGGRPGRILLLGDGTEILTDSDDTEMFDQDEEDKDLKSQVSKGPIKRNGDQDEGRSEREATPGPQAPPNAEKTNIPGAAATVNLTEALSPTTSDTAMPSDTAGTSA